MTAGRKPVRGGFDPIDAFDALGGWKRGLVVAVFLFVVLSLLFPELVFQNRIFVAPDVKAPLSFQTVGRTALAEGYYPLWNPYLFCGMPSYASLAYTPYVYPVSYLTHLLYTYAKFPEMTWLLVHYLLAGIGTYFLARSFGARPSIALLAGALLMSMPNYVAMGANGHGSKACAVAWMPLALLFTRGVLGGKRRIRSAALLAIVLGFQALRGHIQISYYTYLLIGLLLVFETVRLLRGGARREALAGLGLLVAAGAFALGIAAVLVLPVRDYAAWSIRGGGPGGGLDYGYATQWSLHPREMLSFVFPWAYGYGKATYWGSMPFTDYPNYIGIPVALCCLAGLFVLRDRRAWFLVAAAGAATLISFGNHFPLFFDPLFRFLPYFDKFRVPVMILIVQQLALVILAALALEEFMRRAAEGRLSGVLAPAALRWILVACAAVLLLALVGGEAIREGVLARGAVRARVRPEWLQAAAGGYSADLLRTLFVLAAAVAVFYAAAARRLRGGLATAVLGVIALADLISVNGAVVRPERTWKREEYRLIRPPRYLQELARPDETQRWLAGREGFFRIFPVPAAQIGGWGHSVFPFSDNSYMNAGVFSLGGYHAAKLKNYQDVMDVMFAAFNRGAFPLPILNMLGARYFHSRFALFRQDSPFPLVLEREGSYVYENPQALPRIFFVDRYRVLPRPRILETIASEGFDPAGEALLEREPPLAVESAAGSTAEIVDYRLNSIALRARVERPCIMVLSEIDYPDWRALVGGKPRPILTANYCLRAIALEAGEHDILFEFHSPVIRRSLALSIAALALAALAAAAAGPRPGKAVG